MIQINNEWDPLKEIIVGNPTKSTFPKSTENVDISFRLFYHDNLYTDSKNIHVKKNTNYHDVGFIEKKIEDERLEDIEVFINTLNKLHIKVYRPQPYPLKTISGNFWSSVSSPAGTIRDQVLIYKNNIIETSPQLRCRYFENELLYDIFYEKFNSNKNINWYQMPKSRLNDSAFDQSYVHKTFETTNNIFEFMFDGAQCLKFNEGVLVNCSTKNHDMGFEWLDRIFPNQFFKVQFTDSHLDGTIMPIDDGVLLAGPKFYKKYTVADLPKWMHNWEIIKLTDLDKSDADKMCLTSESIFINCLSVGNKQLILNKNAINLRKILEHKNFNVIPLEMRHDRLYGGSFHCITLDLVRG